jgi:hypothetical protein
MLNTIKPGRLNCTAAVERFCKPLSDEFSCPIEKLLDAYVAAPRAEKPEESTRAQKLLRALATGKCGAGFGDSEKALISARNANRAKLPLGLRRLFAVFAVELPIAVVAQNQKITPPTHILE